MSQFTKEQQQAIDDRGHDILVSASAGSGKTTVLVERVLREILSGTQVDELLVITFTKAAAEEMKTRIKQALSAELAKPGSNRRYLRVQGMARQGETRQCKAWRGKARWSGAR